MSRKKTAILVLGCPVCQDEKGLFVNENTYVQLIDNVQTKTDQIKLVARKRLMKNSNEFFLRIQPDQFNLELPDFGLEGKLGFLNAMRFWGNPFTYRRLIALLRQANFIYVEGPTLESFLVALGAWWVGSSIILGCRGDTILNPIYMQQRYGPVGIFYTWLFRNFFKFTRLQTAAALFVSETLQKKYPIRGSLSRAISDVHLPDELFALPRQFSQPAQNYLYVGHLEQIKRVDLIIYALERVETQLPSQWHFRIVGDGPLRENLQQLVSDLHLENHISFLGRIPWGPELFAQYQLADVLLMASTSEGASRTLMEAMAQGLPAISTAVGTAPDLLLPMALAPIGDTQAYAEVLQNILPQPTNLNQLVAHNWQMIQEFRFERLQAERLAFWEEAITLIHLEERSIKP